jgi:ParB family chromosome partitioning protein
MSATTPYGDNLDASPLKYAPKWIRESARSNSDVANSVDSRTADEKSLPRLMSYLDALNGNMEKERVRLGRARTQRRVSIEQLRSNSRNPRQSYSDAEFDALTGSIRERGIIQPIVVRAVLEATDTYEIIAGERRWRAAKQAGLREIPIVLLDVSDSEAFEIAIIENIQRTNLNPLEEAAGYRILADEYGRSQDAIAKIIGKSRSYVANMLRLLELPEEVKIYIHSGQLTACHARALVAQPHAQELAKQIVERGLSVRQTEVLAQKRASDVGQSDKTNVQKRGDTLALEKRLSNLFRLSVKLGRRQNGILQVRYKNFEQLEELLSQLENRLKTNLIEHIGEVQPCGDGDWAV